MSMRPTRRKVVLVSLFPVALICCILIYISNILLKHDYLSINGPSYKIPLLGKYSTLISNKSLTRHHLSRDHVLLTVRTSKSTQAFRLPSILHTWFQFSPNNTHIITNGNYSDIVKFLEPDYHKNIHQTKCQSKYSVANLCCQSGAEFDLYFGEKIEYYWLCRFDDDQYVNVPRLLAYLDQYSPIDQPWYIGKPSWREPKTIRQSKFWFGTFGGGICYSRFLLTMIREEIYPSERFIRGCMALYSPDDIYMAYLLHTKFNINLTIATDFHHHIENGLYSRVINATSIDQAITLGFNRMNMPHFVSIFDQDAFRMRTLHCLLYPNDDCLHRMRLLFHKIYQDQNRLMTSGG